MTEPTGYTALDLVGFTDKGTYNSATAYVKNDLVHYSGDIWRCLIDDTTNITPVEGTNWTLFIEAPTNAIEGIIAPVETNPATNSYAVGRQFIYDDKLYIVITAITAGDTLVAYEDDPSNANIQLADPVETQLLNFEEKAYSTDDSAETSLASDDLVPFYDTSAAAKKKMTVANMIGQTVSNPNLLDNPWFTVNQRGENSYSGSSSYTVDRWRMTNSHSQVDVSDDGIVLTDTDTTASSGAYLLQLLEDSTVNLLLGKTLTYSVIVDNELLSATFVLPETIPDESTTLASLYIDEENVGSVMWLISGSSTLLYFRIMSHYGTPHTFRAVKLELGSVSTLALDTAPNYATELLKCQRYFVRLGYKEGSGINTEHGIGMAARNNRCVCFINFPIAMRAAPTVTYTSGLVLQGGSSMSEIAVTSVGGIVPSDAYSFNEACITIFLDDSTGSLTTGTPYFVRTKDAIIDFSADL